MKTDESGKDLKSFLRGFLLRGAKHKTNWTPFEINDKGISLRNEKALRWICVQDKSSWIQLLRSWRAKSTTLIAKIVHNPARKLKLYNG